MEKNDEVKNKIVQTYAEDMAEVIENDPGGLVKKIIHGEEKHQAEKENLSPESAKNKFFMLSSILLSVAAVAIFSFFFFNKNADTVPVAKQFVPIIFNDQNAFLEVLGMKKDEITQTVLNEIGATGVKQGGIEGIYLTENKQIIGLRRFISLIGGSFVPGNDPLLINDNFLMGVVNDQADLGSPPAKDFFILLKMRSIADIFGPLRAWEEKMFSDLHGFIGIDINAETNYLSLKNFEDGIVENKNARLLYNNAGQLVLMYVFADDNSLIITDSQAAAHEIMLRLSGSQTKQ